MRLQIEGKVYEVEVVDGGDGIHEVTVDGTVYEVRLPDVVAGPAAARKSEMASPAAAPSKPRAAVGAGSVVAPLPGSVTKIEVSEGDRVSQGQTVAMLESMKMNVPVKATRDGSVKKIIAKVGDSLQPDDPILEIG
jgi:biotin carboxyl carrier protein